MGSLKMVSMRQVVFVLYKLRVSVPTSYIRTLHLNNVHIAVH